MPVRATDTSARSSRRAASERDDPPDIGDIFRVDYGDPTSYLEAPPRGTMWYQPGAEGASFRLAKLGKAPFRLDDLIGIHRSDQPPPVPYGKRLMRVGMHAATRGNRLDAAHLYKVVADDQHGDTVWTTRGPRVGYEIGGLYTIAAAPHTPEPPPGTAWELMGPDAENRGHMWAILRRRTD